MVKEECTFSVGRISRPAGLGNVGMSCGKPEGIDVGGVG
jgi:hypothetical protein